MYVIELLVKEVDNILDKINKDIGLVSLAQLIGSEVNMERKVK